MKEPKYCFTLPKLGKGYKWVYKGRGYKSLKACKYISVDEPSLKEEFDPIVHKRLPYGDRDYHYWVAEKVTANKVTKVSKKATKLASKKVAKKAVKVKPPTNHKEALANPHLFCDVDGVVKTKSGLSLDAYINSLDMIAARKANIKKDPRQFDMIISNAFVFKLGYELLGSLPRIKAIIDDNNSR